MSLKKINLKDLRGKEIFFWLLLLSNLLFFFINIFGGSMMFLLSAAAVCAMAFSLHLYYKNERE